MGFSKEDNRSIEYRAAVDDAVHQSENIADKWMKELHGCTCPNTARLPRGCSALMEAILKNGFWFKIHAQVRRGRHGGAEIQVPPGGHIHDCRGFETKHPSRPGRDSGAKRLFLRWLMVGLAYHCAANRFPLPLCHDAVLLVQTKATNNNPQ